ncbi:thiamine phosphate synthase [Nocardioides campestrisoli]|uniref:thiamine phosphate synthase n=1 Tax=Nocardioides campestrisoli TaxID=2736757 RepID=UPI001CD45D08|nr:thiamine phosphate synthase [Nocardioides campestrisoli]
MFVPVLLPRLFCLVSPGDDLSLLPDLVAAGVDGFQVRDKTGTDREVLALAQLVVGAVRPGGAQVVVDDRLDVALAAGADGVHLGADDLPVAAARRVAPDLVVGATCRSRDDVLRAADAGATYAGFGPVWASGSKAGLPAALGPEAVTRAAGVLPLVSIGGVDAARAGAARRAGAHGVAVIAAVWGARDPVAAAKELVAALR